MRNTENFLEGMRAKFESVRDRQDIPYPINDDRRRDWIEGWMQAQRRIKKAREIMRLRPKGAPGAMIMLLDHLPAIEQLIGEQIERSEFLEESPEAIRRWTQLKGGVIELRQLYKVY